MSSLSADAQQPPANSVGDDGSTRPNGTEKIELPGYFEDIVLDDLVVLIADLLQRMVAFNDKIPLSAEGLTRFHSRSIPAISVLEYLRRITKYVRVERSVLLLMLHSIDQICARRPSFNISSLSVHRFIIASITILSKTFCDAFSPNPLFAKVGGVSLIELNLLEREFLSVMDWRLACTREVLHAYYVKLVRTHSSGRYIVPDTSPRPPPIDTLPSDQIEWNFPNGSSESLASTRKRRTAQSASEIANPEDGPQAMEEDESSDSSSDGEDGFSPVLATDIAPLRRFPSRGLSRPASASPAIGGPNPRRNLVTSSSATLEQSIAFMEMRSQNNRSAPATSTTTSAVPPGIDPSATRSPLQTFRSPVVGRRRRRSSSQQDESRAANALLGVDVSDPTAVEGLMRGTRRRRLHMGGKDHRMEIEPGTPG